MFHNYRFFLSNTVSVKNRLSSSSCTCSWRLYKSVFRMCCICLLCTVLKIRRYQGLLQYVCHGTVLHESHGRWPRNTTPLATRCAESFSYDFKLWWWINGAWKTCRYHESFYWLYKEDQNSKQRQSVWHMRQLFLGLWSCLWDKQTDSKFLFLTHKYKILNYLSALKIYRIITYGSYVANISSENVLFGIQPTKWETLKVVSCLQRSMC